MKIADCMSRDVQTVTPDQPIREAAQFMLRADAGSMPVLEDDRLIGMVTDRDIVCRCIAAGLDPEAATAREVMTEGIVFCLDKQELDDATRVMERKKVRRLPVIDGKKRMIGMLSLGDVYHAAPRAISKEAMQGVSAHHGRGG